MDETQDPIANVSERICSHMNADHVDSLQHLVMFYERLPQFPVWCHMTKICADHMVIGYVSTTQQYLLNKKASAIKISFEPPLQSMMDARQRLVSLSKKSEEENVRVLQQTSATTHLWERWNLDALLLRTRHFIAEPVTVAMLGIMLSMALYPSKVTQNEWLQHQLATLLWPLQVITVLFSVVLVILSILWLDRVWTNASPVPEDIRVLPTWLVATLFRRTLPILTKEAWSGQTVVVTGGASGLGAALVQKLAGRGAKVASIDVSSACVDHEQVTAYTCDISRRDDVSLTMNKIVEECGQPTMLINNAGVVHGMPLPTLPSESIARTMETNVMGPFWLIKEVLPTMIRNNSGHIVTVSSIMGYAGFAKLTDYTASKHALVGLHESLRYELDSIHKAPHVRTTLVTTGQLQDTPMFDGVTHSPFVHFVAPSISAHRVADAIVEALEQQESRHIAMPWYASWTPALRLLPSFVRDGIQTALGANHAMPSPDEAYETK